ncbi:MAG: glycoside hydrolase family 3 N-terminal domain-containing protein [Pyrinomonadaceae bacterium]
MTDQFCSLSLEQKVGQLFIIGIPGAALDDETRLLLDEVSPGGICLFARNIRDAAQTRLLLDELRSASSIGPFLSVDQEGGLVDRLRRITGPMPAASLMQNSDNSRELGSIIGDALSLLGFNFNFAPVVDVINAGRSEKANGLYSRGFGQSAESVVENAAAFLLAMQEQGVLGCLKHFPGLGAARVDSHEDLPVIPVSEADFTDVDLRPFRELIADGNIVAVMAAHAVFPAINLQSQNPDGKPLPASLNPVCIDGMLRRDVGFTGIVITDDLEMGAIVNNYGIGEACRLAIAAGVDMLAICSDPDKIREGYRSVLEAVSNGEIAEARIDASLQRVAQIKSQLPAPPEFDSGKVGQLSNRIAKLSERLAHN